MKRIRGACFLLALSLGLASVPVLSVRTVFGAATKEEKQKLDAAAEETADRQFADMKLRIKYMYEKGETGFLDMLLNARNLTDFFNHAEYIEKISEYDRAQLDAYEATCMEIEQKKENVEAESVTLEGLKTDQEAKQESSKMLLAEKQNELSKYSAQISSAVRAGL